MKIKNNTLIFIALGFLIGSMQGIFISWIQMILFSIALGLLTGLIIARVILLEKKIEELSNKITGEIK